MLGDGGTRAAGHAIGRVARGYTPRLKTSFPHSRKGHALSGLALRASGRRDGVSRLLKGGQVGADREIGRLQQSQENHGFHDRAQHRER